jgi:hypothetical protein
MLLFSRIVSVLAGALANEKIKNSTKMVDKEKTKDLNLIFNYCH